MPIEYLFFFFFMWSPAAYIILKAHIESDFKV